MCRAGRFTTAVLTLAVGVGLTGTALAADMPVKAKPMTPRPVVDTWTYSLTPNFWTTSLSGSVTAKGRTVDVDAGFFDILEHTQFPKGLFELGVFGEARRGPFSVFTDFTYMKLGLGQSLNQSRDVGRLATLSIGAQAQLEIQMIVAEIGAAYEVARWNAFNAPGASTALDIYGGGRIWWQQANVQLAVSGNLAGLGPLGLTLNGEGWASATKDVTWVDPVVGVRLRHNFRPGIDLIVSGDIGGFGAGSQFSWQALAALDWQFAKVNNVTWNGMIGYKALYVDYSQGSGPTEYTFDMTIYGPIFGVTAKW